MLMPIRIRIWIGNNMEIRIRIGINDADQRHCVGKLNFVFRVHARNQNYVLIWILSIYRTGSLLSLTTTGTRFLLHTLLKLEAMQL